MALNFKSSAAQWTVGLVVFAIIGSFVLTGIGLNDSGLMLSSSSDVASVDGTPVSVREYQNAVQQQSQFYSQMMGGKDLTTAQMEQFGVKKAALDRLIQNKLMLNLANEINIEASRQEIKAEIKELPYFKTNEVFDVNKYKMLLNANGFSPSDFEEVMANDIKVRKISGLFQAIPASEKLANDIARFKAQTVTIDGVQIQKRELFKYISISKEDALAYLKDEKNLAKTQSLHTQRKEKYDKPEEVKARHILLNTEGKDEKEVLAKAKALRKKINKNNFKTLANANTEDPSGKTNGGDLGWFARGRMVPEFEESAFNQKKGSISEPIKTAFGYHIILVEDKKAAKTTPFEDAKIEIATELIQKTKAKELDELFNKIVADIESNYKSGNTKAIASMAKKYALKRVSNQKVNLYDFNPAGLSLTLEEAQTMFNSKDTVHTLKKPAETVIVHLQGKATEKEITEVIEKTKKTEMDALTQNITRTLTNDIMEKRRESASISTNEKLL